ncbi:MAG: hypothetical protein PHE25_04890 [Candidatus Gracilibacteria bacterium]|nr:hypothetical protein [Candidatus Gracilibacteria bacterium]
MSLNFLKSGIETPEGISKFEQRLFFLRNSGFVGNLLLLAFLSAPIGIGSITVSQLVENYKSHTQEVLQGKPSRITIDKLTGKIITYEHICGSGGISRFYCEPALKVSEGKVKVLEADSIDIYSEEYIRNLLEELQEFAKNNPEILKISIIGKSPLNSTNKQENLENAKYIKSRIIEQSPELASHIDIFLGIIGELSQEDLLKTKAIARKVVGNGNLQALISKYNSGYLQLSDEDRSFIINKLFGGVKIILSGVKTTAITTGVSELESDIKISIPIILFFLWLLHKMVINLLFDGLEKSIERLKDLESICSLEAVEYRLMLGKLTQEQLSDLFNFLHGLREKSRISVGKNIFYKDKQGKWVNEGEVLVIKNKINSIIDSVQRRNLELKKNSKGSTLGGYTMSLLPINTSEIEENCRKIEKLELRIDQEIEAIAKMTDEEMVRYIEDEMIRQNISREMVLNHSLRL